MNAYVTNILDTFAQASPQERAEGLTWYASAHDVARDLAGDVHVGAGVIAALSPQMQWDENIKLAEAWFRKGKRNGHTSPNVRKARHIIEGTRNPFDVLYPVEGKKVWNFFNNIVTRGEDVTFVTIDRHAYSIALGRECDDKERQSIRRKLYETLKAAYIEAAKHVGLSPAQLQATVWLTWRNRLGGTNFDTTSN